MLTRNLKQLFAMRTRSEKVANELSDPSGINDYALIRTGLHTLATLANAEKQSHLLPTARPLGNGHVRGGGRQTFQVLLTAVNVLLENPPNGTLEPL